jgi:hypothetical protein
LAGDAAAQSVEAALQGLIGYGATAFMFRS